MSSAELYKKCRTYHKLRTIKKEDCECIIEKNVCTLLHPEEFLLGNDIVLPERVITSDGSTFDDVRLYHERIAHAFRAVEHPITLYAGKNIVEWFDTCVREGWDERLDTLLEIPLLAHIELLETEIKSTSGAVYTTENGILYRDGEITWVPPFNKYAQTLPLSPITIEYHLHNHEETIKTISGNKDVFGGVYSADGKVFLRLDESIIPIRNYVVKEDVEEIAEDAFYTEWTKGIKQTLRFLHTVTLPEGLKRIGKRSFGHSDISQINVPSTVAEIDDEAFAGCISLQDIILPKGVKHIGAKAFSDCGFRTIRVPKGCSYIGENCFYGCAHLDEIKISNS